MAARAGRLSTIGYQGKTISTFLREVADAGADVLVDVRRLPVSRKPGFSKRRLNGALRDLDIDYRHYPDLGMPRELLKYRNRRDNSPILAAYDAQIERRSDLIDEVAALARHHHVGLLCFEVDPAQCHRGILANHIGARLGLDVEHL